MKIQEQYMQLQMLAQTIKQGQQQAQAIEMQLQELKKAKRTINSLKKGQEVLFPISAGVFAQGKIEQEEELIVNVGAGVAVKKTTKNALGIIESQLSELKKYQQELIGQIQDQANKAQRLEKQIEEGMKKEK